MQTKTIKRVVSNKLNEWLDTIDDVKLRDRVRNNLVVSGGCLTSMFQNEPVNDFDIYIQDINVLIELANYYVPNRVLDGRLRDFYLRQHFAEFDDSEYNINKMMADIYNNHIEQVEIQLARECRELPKMKLNSNVKSIFDFTFEDFVLEGYDPHPHIKGKVAI